MTINEAKNIDLEEIITKSNEYQKKYNLFVTIISDIKKNNLNGPLANVVYTTKDNFSTKDILTTASSNTLKNYIPIYDATVISKLNSLGAINIGKTAMDELGMGGTGLTAHTGPVINPFDETRIPGGSSSGSAVSVATNLVPFSLGSDTGDSIRKPAAYLGVVGYKPTYGLISRYGLIPFASSLDHVGVFTTNVYDVALVVDNIKGLDENDMTTFDSSKMDLLSNLKDKVNPKLFYIEELGDVPYFQEVIKKLESTGIKVEPVSIDINILNALKPTYDCISSAETTSNNSNLTGILFGGMGEGESTEEMMIDYRTKNLNSEVKRRFVIGSFVLQKENQEKYFLNACRVRRLIVENISDLFNTYDGLIMPASGGVAPKIDELDSEVNEALENNLLIGNFGGFPSITIPAANIDNLPVGINLTCQIKEDAKLLNIAYNLEEIINYKGVK